MRSADVIRKLRGRFRMPAPIFRVFNRSKPKFTCPICAYHGPFRDLPGFAGRRKHAVCPGCHSMERHRLQYLVFKKIVGEIDASNKVMLHIAPEPFFRQIFSIRFGRYETADLEMNDVDHKVDLLRLPFGAATYDVVYASHVLEHIADDSLALSEIRRVLKPGGLAVLPVPVVCEKTVEYREPNPGEAYHVRAPGFDYFDRFKKHFRRVELHTSEDVPSENQPFVYENRSVWPTQECPLRPPMSGEKHLDVVPVCYV